MLNPVIRLTEAHSQNHIVVPENTECRSNWLELQKQLVKVGIYRQEIYAQLRYKLSFRWRQ